LIQTSSIFSKESIKTPKNLPGRIRNFTNAICTFPCPIRKIQNDIITELC